MTLADVVASDKTYLTPEDVAELLGCDPNTLRAQAQEDPRKLGLPVVVMGSRVKIPRLGFLHFWLYGYAYPQEQEAIHRKKPPNRAV